MAITLDGTSGITTPDINTTAQTSTLLPKGVPAFRAYMNNGGANFSFPIATQTKIPFDTITFDTDSFFDNTTNYRFQPTVAGYYQIVVNASISFTSTGGNVAIAYIHKNGSQHSRAGLIHSSASIYGIVNIADIIYLNGSTDYVEGYVYYNSPTAIAIWSSDSTFMSGVLVRAD